MSQGETRRTLVIQELPQTQGGASPDQAARFEWDRQTQTSHRGTWKVGVKVRTVREDYAGTDEVTEQVLGTNFQPFSMAGIWDSRYSSSYSPTFAIDTLKKFRAMVRRANPVQVSLETESYVGIITDFESEYDKEWRIGWSFTLSPHYQKASGDVRKTGAVPKQNPSARVVVQQVAALIDTLSGLHASVPAPYMVGGMVADIQSKLDDIEGTATELQNTVKNQLVPTSVSSTPSLSTVSPLSRMVQGLQKISTDSADVLYSMQGATNYSSASYVAPVGPYFTTSSLGAPAQAGTSASLAYDLALPTISFDVWRSGMASICRQLVFQTNQLAASLSSQIKPDIQSIYIPRPGESLYHISDVVYGTPDGWRDIYERNRLVSYTLHGTENLIIPARGTGQT